MTPAELAEAVVAELARGTNVLVEALTDDPRSEAALTALADLSLLGAVLERHSEGTSISILARSLRGILAKSSVCDGPLPPGPEAWALHACRAWLDPAAERRRLEDRQSREIVDGSRRVVLTLGPNWRPEEVAYVAACLNGSDLPALRPVKSDVTARSAMYELAHIAFYATDFGAAPAARGSIAANLVATAAGVIGQLEKTASNWDVGVELILAARYLSGHWPKEANAWIRSLIPNWLSVALSSLRDGPERFLGVYHAAAVSALALIQVQANGRGFDEGCPPQD